MNRIKIGICIGLTCLMLIGCQEGIRNYIGAVGLTRVHADESVVCRSNSPCTSSFIEKLGRSIRRALYASAREVYESRRVREASASDGGGAVGDYEYAEQTDVLAEEVIDDSGEYPDMAEEDSGAGLTYLGAWTATAYCACPICCGEYSSGYTASGTLATEGRTIACNALPMGTQVMIDGNIYVVEDTGWSPYGENWLDIFFYDHESALAYGMRTVDVYLVN